MRTGTCKPGALIGAGLSEYAQTGLHPDFLHLVTPHETRVLKEALAAGQLPADFERKLLRLEARDFMYQFIAQNCRCFSVLLSAAYSGQFREATPSDCETILRVLAYVRKDDDAIPDYLTGGFTDDLHEVRLVLNRFQHLLTRFKAWRLCHQVPGMWRN